MKWPFQEIPYMYTFGVRIDSEDVVGRQIPFGFIEQLFNKQICGLISYSEDSLSTWTNQVDVISSSSPSLVVTLQDDSSMEFIKNVPYYYFDNLRNYQNTKTFTPRIVNFEQSYATITAAIDLTRMMVFTALYLD